MSKSNLTASRVLSAGTILAVATIVSGCMGSTYGTGTPSGQQTLEDVTGMLTVQRDRGEPIAYQPRGELVRPGSTEVLPPPQQSASRGEAWPESPEQRLARVREDATANQDNNQYRADVRGTRSANRLVVPSCTDADGNECHHMAGNLDRDREQFNQRLAATRQGDPNQRRFLSEPPTSYRQPSATAPVGDVGEDEWRKERAASRAQGKSSWRDWVPGL